MNNFESQTQITRKSGSFINFKQQFTGRYGPLAVLVVLRHAALPVCCNCLGENNGQLAPAPTTYPECLMLQHTFTHSDHLFYVCIECTWISAPHASKGILLGIVYKTDDGDCGHIWHFHRIPCMFLCACHERTRTLFVFLVYSKDSSAKSHHPLTLMVRPAF